jgi:hypothetical protein
MILRPHEEPVVIFRNRAVSQMVGVFAFEDNHNGDSEDFDSQRDVKNVSRKVSTVF